MVSLLIGIVLIGFCVFSCLGLNWTSDIVSFLKGFAPCFAAFCGLISVFIGFADIKDKKEAKKEENAAKSIEKK
ncbi:MULTISPECIES: hypothetical protein [unclassified Treponema]|uniref:hypothetical protein n=1 Tax=unclassified Treponema TaxID=2638727 RepID=UPI000E8ACC51|nr:MULTISPECIES: hypothetical protein [unclassified Treponema]MDO5774068.1 hypothetical protein [Spirochaetales bacterium]HBP09663.1 hypothetical protein [Treponema sp.]